MVAMGPIRLPENLAKKRRICYYALLTRRIGDDFSSASPTPMNIYCMSRQESMRQRPRLLVLPFMLDDVGDYSKLGNEAVVSRFVSLPWNSVCGVCVRPGVS